MFKRIAMIMALSLVLSFSLALADGPVDQPSTGYGADGAYSVSSFQYNNPKSWLRKCYIFYPVGGTPAPTVFFSHPYGGTDPDNIRGMFEHIASRGNTLVFCQYPTLFASHTDRYDYLRQGFEEAIDSYSAYCDSDQVGWLGYSYGGGATPRMAIDGIANGWGGDGKFIMTLAPWYSFELTDNDLSNFDSDVKANFIVFDDDSTNDQRMAIDIYDNINIASSEIDYYIVYSDSNCSYDLVADHNAPATNTEEDGLDYYGIWRHLDALIDYTFTGSTAAKAVCLGGGSATQTEMGVFNCDSTDVTECDVPSSPTATQAESFYTFPWSSTENPRY